MSQQTGQIWRRMLNKIVINGTCGTGILPLWYFTVILYIFTILSHSTVILYCHTLLSYSNVILYCHTLLSYSTVILYCHTLLSYSTVILYGHTLLSYSSVILYWHTLLSYSTVIFYCPKGLCLSHHTILYFWYKFGWKASFIVLFSTSV